jgi:hypothetical protein
MVILDPDIVRASIGPAEGEPPLVVDAYTISWRRVAFQLLQPVTRRLPHIGQPFRRFKLTELATCRIVNIRRELAYALAAKERMGFTRGEAADHVGYLSPAP